MCVPRLLRAAALLSLIDVRRAAWLTVESVDVRPAGAADALLFAASAFSPSNLTGLLCFKPAINIAAAAAAAPLAAALACDGDGSCAPSPPPATLRPRPRWKPAGWRRC